jgi:hypothetical protein
MQPTRDAKPGKTPSSPEGGRLAERVYEILSLLARAVSSIKIFSLSHSTSQRLLEALWSRLGHFLEEHYKLEVGVREYSFLYEDKVVYREEKALKSLPFLLYKDGTKKILFDKGVRREELLDFILLLKDAFESRQDDLDLVHLLWERDYPHIRCFAPDSFLEAKIALNLETQTPDADAAALNSGTVELASEDRSSLMHALNDGSAFGSETQPPLDLETSLAGGDGGARLSHEEDLILKQMLQLNRKMCSEMEMVFLISEILYLESRPKQFSEALSIMDRIHQELIRKGRFDCAAQLLNNTFAAAARLSLDYPSPGSLISQFLDRVRSTESFSLVRSSVLQNRPQDYGDFFNYIRLLGPEAMLVLGEIYDQLKAPSYTAALTDYLHSRAREDPPSLLRLAVPSRPALTRTIIDILGMQPSLKALELLGTFREGWHKSVRLEAVHALGGAADDARSRVLADFLDDDEEEVRIAAARNIRAYQDAMVLGKVRDIVLHKHFYRKIESEKSVLVDLLGRIRTPESIMLLEDLLRLKSGLRHRARKTAVRLAAARALGLVGTPEARTILERCSRRGRRKVRKACREALKGPLRR